MHLPSIPPPEFVAQVKDALEHLYDFPYLQQHPLARATSAEIAGQRLRQELIAAIETLNPGPAVPFRAPPARLYRILICRYVEGMTVQAIAHDLSVSYRQAMRDLRRGEKSVAAVLWAQRAAVEQDAARVSSFEVEMARLSLTTSPTDVSALVERARRAVTGQAERRGIRLHTTLPQPGVVVSTDPLLAEQALITLFSQVVGQAQSDVAITLAVQEGGALLKLCYEPESSAGAPGEAAVERLLDRLGWVVYREEGTGHRYEVGVRIRPAGPIVLIVDDNMGLINLLQRYLVNHACRVIGAQSGAEGLRLAQELRPAVILLDVMMPGMHGWDVLQRLHNDPHTADIPVIVCSVLPNPDLALSLGAALFLPKPVRQEDVLNALRQLGIV
jgi:CheY-like chemotaxis protein